MFKPESLHSDNSIKTSRNSQLTSHQNRLSAETKKHSNSTFSKKRQENLNSDIHSTLSHKTAGQKSISHDIKESHPAWFG